MNGMLSFHDKDILLISAVMAVLYQNGCDKELLIGLGLLLLMISGG